MGQRGRCGLALAAVGIAMGMGDPARAQSYTVGCDMHAFEWTEFTDAAGSVEFMLMEGACSGEITGGDSGTPGETEAQSVAPVNMTLSILVEYSSSDVEDYDQAYYVVNGEQTFFADNANQGEFALTLELEADDTFALGVLTKDGIAGPGVLTVNRFDARSEPVSYRMYPWTFEAEAGGSGFLTGGCVEITGGNEGAAGDAKYTVDNPLTGDLHAVATYTSEDTGQFDSAFYLADFTSSDPGDYEKETFATNATQGVFPLQFPVNNGFGDEYATLAGFGVETADGLLEPGHLAVRDVVVRAAPQRVGDVDWKLTGDGHGAFISALSNAFVLEGGNSGAPGTFSVEIPAHAAFRVQADAEYSSQDDGGPYDKAFYFVDDEVVVFADNDSQGQFELDFEVPAGSTFGFGIETVDGLGGAGVLVVSDFRAFVSEGLEPCPADFNADGQLNVADFVAFQGAFSSERLCADLNADGSFSVLDFIAFQNAFGAGCQPLP